MISRYIALVFTICLFLSLTTRIAEAQSVYGQISGTFSDSSGAPVAGAKITVTSIEKGSKVTASTNQSGYFVVTDLLPDNYSLKVEAGGFKTYEDHTVPVYADYTSRMDVKLARGEAKELTAGTPGDVSILKVDRTDVSTILSHGAINDLPFRDIHNLNASRFELLVPGALPTSIALASSQNPQGGRAINVNGQHWTGTAFQLDGTDNRDPLEGLIVINPGLESVTEMKVTTQNYSAEFGEATSGVVTIQTQSGTNAWHGSAYEYRLSDWGEAQDPFSLLGPAPTRRNVFGASLGGPIAKNRIFIFGNYQGARDSLGSRLLLSVPTNQVRSTCVGPNSGGPANCDLSEYPFAIYDPKSHQQYAGNLIPNNAKGGVITISPQAVSLMQFLPAPNFGGPHDITNNYLVSGAEGFNGDESDMRMDFNASSKLKVFGRYSFADFRQDGVAAFGLIAGGQGINPDEFAGTGRTRNQGLSTGFAYTFRPSLVTDFRFGYFRYRLNLDSPDMNSRPVDSILPGLVSSDPLSNGMPDFEIPGQLNLSPNGDYLRFGYSLQANSCNCPLREREQQFQWVNNWTKTSGNHQFKWGTDIRYLQNYRLSSSRRRAGHFTFDPSKTSTSSDPTSGLGLATFLIGRVTAFDRFVQNPADPDSLDAGERQYRYFFYGQDTWRVSPRLTVNFGLRWEIYNPQTVTGAAAGGFLVPVFTNLPASPFNVPGTSGIGSNGGIEHNYKNFGPRVGIAYLIAPKTVLRAGYGRSFDVGFGGSIFGVSATQNPPVMAFEQSAPFTLAQLANPTTQLNFVFPATGTPFTINTLAADDPNKNRALVYAVPGRLRLPTVDSWNFTIQHELSSTTYFELSYVGNKGTHLFTDGTDDQPYYNLNQPSLTNFIIHSSSNPGLCASPASLPFCTTSTLSRKLFQPWPAPIRYFGNDSSNNYNALQTKIEKQFRSGYGLLAHYTWSKGLDHDSAYFPFNPRVGYGPANFDRTHAFVMTNIWALPIGRGKALLGSIGPGEDKVVGGWSISAVTSWYSGLPFTPSYFGCGQDQDSAVCRPNVVGNIKITGSRNAYFSTTGGNLLSASCFGTGTNQVCGFDPNTGIPMPGASLGPWQRPGAGQIGNIARNSLRGPGFFQSDISVGKQIFFTEQLNLRFRADILNAFNKVNMALPNSCVDCVGTQGAGTISSLASGAYQREYQFSLKLQF